MNARRKLRVLRIRPSGIRWQLTVSYTLVVIAAAAALSGLAAIRALSRGSTGVERATIVSLLQKDAAAVRTIGSERGVVESLRFLAVIPTVEDLSRRTHRAIAVAVLDPNGRLVVADSCTRSAYATGRSGSCQRVADALVRPLLSDPRTRRLLRGATHGRRVSGEVAGRAFAAAPVLASGKQPRGALVAAFDGALPAVGSQSPLARFWDQWTTSLPKDWLALIALTILLGGALGLLLSRSLVNRLRRIARVVSIWSSGDLTPVADASRADEIGRLAADMNRMAEEMRGLLEAHSELATQNERRRVQRDLHDGIKQDLFATSMQLATAQASLPRLAGADADVAETVSALDQARASCRRAQHELAALLDQAPLPASAGLSLARALSELGDRLARENGLRIVQHLDPDERADGNAHAALYRIAQEALTNVVRHAGATTVTLTLSTTAGETRLRIDDDGRGFPPERRETGLGLRVMRERIEALGGCLTVETTSTGTAVEATLPASPG